MNRSRPAILPALAILAGVIACGRGSTDAPGSAPAGSTPPAAGAVAPLQPLAPGDRVPSAVLAGARHWDRGGVAGQRILVINFALDDERLRAVHEQVRATPVLKGAAGLLTLTDDPNAMPAALRVHADRVQADPEIWRFAALAPGVADRVIEQFAGSVDRGVVAIVDAEGNLAKSYAGRAWTADEVVRDLKSLVLRADPVVIAAYIAAQEALARDDVSAAKRELARVSRAVGEPAVSRLAAAAADRRDLAGVRAAFKPLSEALVRLPWPRPYQAMYCPMFDGNAGATWVQTAGPVLNPYYGSQMLRCGTDLSLGAHTDHSPLYGGILFMAADQFHHIEGSYTEDGLFRVRIYDNFKKPIRARGFKGTAAPGDKPPVLRLMPSDDGMTLEAKVGTLPFPAEITVVMTLDPRGPDERFDFVFASHSPPAPSDRVRD